MQKTNVSRFGVLFLLSFGALCASLMVFITARAPKVVQAAPSAQLNFQARLLTSGGAPVADGFYNIRFKLYDAITGGSLLWTETWYDANGVTAGQDNRVRVTDGYLSVSLATHTAFPAIDWGSQHFITMDVGGTDQTTPSWNGEMLNASSQRMQLTAVPYAFSAANVGSGDTNAASTHTSGVAITTGDALGATSNSGSITMDVGNATGTKGTISLGGTYASALTVGNSGATTTIAGTLSANTVTSTGAMTIGNTGQTMTLQGSTATITSTGAGNDVILNSADTIELQDNTNITGLLAVSGASATIGGANQAGSIVLYDDGAGSETVTLTTANITGSYSLKLPTAAGGTAECLKTDASDATQLVFGGCTGSGSSLFTDGGTFTYLTATTDDLVIGDNTVAGASLYVDESAGTTTFGNSGLAGTLYVSDGTSNTVGITASGVGSNYVLTLPNAVGNGSQCLKNSATPGILEFANCNNGSGSGGAVTLQDAYDAGNTISTDLNGADGNIAITLADTATDRNFTITVADGATGYASISRADGTGTVDPAQLLLIDNADATRIIGDGLKITAAAGGITDALDVSDGDIVNAINVGDNVILGTTGVINFTSFDVAATGEITTASNITVQGGTATVGGAAQAGSLVLYDNGAGSETVTLTTANITTSYNLKLPTAAGGTGECLKTDGADAEQLVFAACNGGAVAAGWTDGGTEVYSTANGDDFTIGATSSVGKLGVVGDADEVQFYVQANATQNANLVLFEQSGGADILTVSNAGNMGILGDLTVNGTGTSTLSGSLSVQGNMTLGNLSSDTITFTGSVNSAILPATDDTYALGSDSFRWSDIYVGPATLHIGTSTLDEGTISYNTTGNIMVINNGAADVDFQIKGDLEDNLFYADAGNGRVGIGDATPVALLTVGANDAFQVVGTGFTRIGSGGTNSVATGAGDLYLQDALEVDGEAVLGSVSGAGLSGDCDTAATSKLLWDITTKQFSCGTDQTGGGTGSYIEAAPAAVQTINSANTAIFFNQTGAGSLVNMQANGVSIMTLAKSGAFTLNTTVTGVGSYVELAADTFTRANGALGTAETGGAWAESVGGGAFAIASNKVGPGTVGSESIAYIDVNKTNDVEIEADMFITASTTNDFGISVLALDRRNAIFAGLYKNGATQEVNLYKTTPGGGTNTSYTSLVTPVAITLNDSTTYNMRVVITNTYQITVYIDDVLRITHTLSAGDITSYGSNDKYGFRVLGGSAGNWDNFVVRDLDQPIAGADTASSFFGSASTGTRVSSDSTSAFTVEAVDGEDYLTVSTSTNHRIRVGNGTDDVQVVLDNFSAEPTGEAGSMYYSTTYNTFRCYEQSKWNDCLSRHVIVLPGDIADSSGNCTFTNVTSSSPAGSLSFAAATGRTYRFHANIGYTAAAAGTGAGFTVTTPTTSFLTYQTNVAAGAAIEYQSYGVTSGSGSCATNSAATTGNTATLEGMMTTTGAGTFMVQFATEANLSAITIKAGSTLEWW